MIFRQRVHPMWLWNFIHFRTWKRDLLCRSRLQIMQLQSKKRILSLVLPLKLKAKSNFRTLLYPGSIALGISIFKAKETEDKPKKDEDSKETDEANVDTDLNRTNALNPDQTYHHSKAFVPDDPRLRSSECLKNAACIAVDSSSAVLSQTVHAMIKIEEEYIQLIEVLVKLLWYHTQVLGHKQEEERIADLILEARYEVNKAKRRKQDLSMLFSSAEKMAEASAEAAFIAGATYASTSMGERLHSAQREVRKHENFCKQAEERLRKVEAKTIEASDAHKVKEKRESSSSDVSHEHDPLHEVTEDELDGDRDSKVESSDDVEKNVDESVQNA